MPCAAGEVNCFVFHSSVKKVPIHCYIEALHSVYFVDFFCDFYTIKRFFFVLSFCLFHFTVCLVVTYDTGCCFNVRSKSDMSVNLPHGTN